MIKLKTNPTSPLWNKNKRFKVGESVIYDNISWTNLSGRNSEPSFNNPDWDTIYVEKDFTELQIEQLSSLVYVKGTQSLTVAPTFSEKGVSTDLVFSWNVILNQDTLISSLLDGNDVSGSVDGIIKTYEVNGALVTKSVSLISVLSSDDSNNNLSNTKSVPFYIPQYTGKISTSEPSSTYLGLSSYNKFIQSSTNLTINQALNDEYLFLLCNNSNKTVKDNLTGFTLSLGEWDSTTAFMIKKTFEITLLDGTTENLTLFRTREKKTQTLNISLV